MFERTYLRTFLWAASDSIRTCLEIFIWQKEKCKKTTEQNKKVFEVEMIVKFPFRLPLTRDLLTTEFPWIHFHQTSVLVSI